MLRFAFRGAGLMLSLSPEEHPKFRTECWLERCLFEGRVCNVEENITYSPLVIVRPLDSAYRWIETNYLLKRKGQTI